MYNFPKSNNLKVNPQLWFKITCNEFADQHVFHGDSSNIKLCNIYKIQIILGRIIQLLQHYKEMEFISTNWGRITSSNQKKMLCCLNKIGCPCQWYHKSHPKIVNHLKGSKVWSSPQYSGLFFGWGSFSLDRFISFLSYSYFFVNGYQPPYCFMMTFKYKDIFEGKNKHLSTFPCPLLIFLLNYIITLHIIQQLLGLAVLSMDEKIFRHHFWSHNQDQSLPKSQIHTMSITPIWLNIFEYNS